MDRRGVEDRVGRLTAPEWSADVYHLDDWRAGRTSTARADGPLRSGADQVRILGLSVDNDAYDVGLERLRRLIATEGTQVVHFIHCHGCLLGAKDRRALEALSSADVVYGDGTGMRWAARWRGVDLLGNLNATDLVPDLFEQGIDRRGRVYLLGGCPEEVAAAHERAVQRYPHWDFVGFHHGYFEPHEECEVVARVRAAQPDLVLVGMGTPLQETFIHRHRDEFGCSLVIGVGGLFAHLSGRLGRVPPWMRRRGLEWVGVVIQQPWKLGRYTLGSAEFLVRMLIARRADRTGAPS